MSEKYGGKIGDGVRCDFHGIKEIAVVLNVSFGTSGLKVIVSSINGVFLLIPRCFSRVIRMDC